MKRFVILLFCIIFTLLCGCNQIEPPSVTVSTDDSNKPPVKPAYPVSFDNESFSQAPRRVASLSPAITEILKDIGAHVRLVGVSKYCDDEGLSALHIGSPADPDLETIISLKPDLLITQSPLASTDIIKLNQAGVRVLQLEIPSSFAYLCEQYVRLAMIFYGNVDSQEVAVSALKEIDQTMLSAGSLALEKSFVVITGKQGKKYSVAKPDTIASDMLSVFGENLVDENDDILLTTGELAGLKPDIVFCDESLDSATVKSLFTNSPRVILIPTQSFEAPTAHLSEVIKNITEALK